MKYFAIKMPVLRYWEPVLYELEQDSQIQSYEDFEYLKSLCNPIPSLWEIIRINIDGKNYIMLVDESGLYQKEPIVNQVASYLYSRSTVPIVGDVFLLRERGDEILWLDQNDIGNIQTFYETAIMPLSPFYFENKKLK